MRGQQLLSRLVPHLTQEHVHSILQVMGVNTQIRDSRTCPDVLENIYNEELVPTGEFNRRSLRLNSQWRLIVELESDDEGKYVLIVSIEDYH